MVIDSNDAIVSLLGVLKSEVNQVLYKIDLIIYYIFTSACTKKKVST